MKLRILTATILLLLAVVIDTALAVSSDVSPTRSSSTKSMTYPKKVTSLKKRPTKSPTTAADTVLTSEAKIKKSAADVTEAFKDLPQDDLEFIKELDKQFKLHGSKIKIKVEHDNTTDAKNSKRTIDGELGYGYNHNGYEYARPKFMFYPYSQKDIPSDAPGYYPKYEMPAVTIEPSYSYELEPQKYEIPNEEPQVDLPQHHQQPPQQEPHAQQYEEPVIVLRIPGPTKYATHLQRLLQQYLEIRAAQYLRLLEEAELQKHQHHEQQQQQLQPQYDHQQLQPESHQHYEQPSQVQFQPIVQQIVPAIEPQYPQEVNYAHQMAPTPQPVAYPAIDDVYQTYKGRHQHQQLQQQQHHQQEQEVHHVSQEQQPPPVPYYPDTQSHQAYQPENGVSQYYYSHEQQYGDQGQGHPGHSYQQVYLIAMAPGPAYEPSHGNQFQQQPIYVHDDGSSNNEHAHIHGHESSLSINENSPRKTHTKVIFTQNNEQGGADYSNMYPLPSIRPYERHAPTSMPPFHQNYQHESHATAASVNSDQISYDHQAPVASAHAHQHQQQDTVAITQRPFNYHAHALKARKQRGRKRFASPTPKSPEETDHHFQKIQQYVRENLGARKGNAVEFKTTEVIEG